MATKMRPFTFLGFEVIKQRFYFCTSGGTVAETVCSALRSDFPVLPHESRRPRSCSRARSSTSHAVRVVCAARDITVRSHPTITRTGGLFQPRQNRNQKRFFGFDFLGVVLPTLFADGVGVKDVCVRQSSTRLISRPGLGCVGDGTCPGT